MAVDFSNVQVGDRVKLSRENGDEYTFTVEYKTRGSISVESKSDAIFESEWDSLEILGKPWHEANAGDVWKFEFPSTDNMLQFDGKYWQDSAGYANNVYDAVKATRVWPVVK